jgi:hypothetical protein
MSSSLFTSACVYTIKHYHNNACDMESESMSQCGSHSTYCLYNAMTDPGGYGNYGGTATLSYGLLIETILD